MPRISGILVCFFLTWVVACSETGDRKVPAAVAPPVQASNAELSSYALRNGDSLLLKFFYNPELNQAVTVNPNGRIGLHLVGDVEAAGLHPNELQKIITERYAKTLRQPDVTVTVQQYAPRLFYIFGEVNRPGGYPHQLGMTVVGAVSLAGGFTYRANQSEVRITRGEGAAGQPWTAPQQTPILPGDVIEVPQRFF